MKKNLSRRDFAKLTGAAFGGIMAGSMLGCDDPKNKEPLPNQPATDTDEHDEDEEDHDHDHAEGDDATHDASLLVEGKNVCRGLNHSCANHKDGDNTCAGAGACATAEAHTCAGENACKGEGGCGAYPGQNACKGKGECGVPLEEKAWKTARASFEKAMTAAGKKFGDAPAAG